MRRVFVLILLSLSVLEIYSQVNINAPWTWVNGEKHLPMWGANGTIGVTAPTNSPGGRKHAVSWQDQNGMIWVFGGFGYGGNSVGYLNDLWKYDPLTNEWTWINGDNTVNVPGVYGTQGVASSTNKPGSRRGSVGWTDSDGKFYLFGGHGYSASSGGRLNDLWKYDPGTNEWTWLNGSSAADIPGVYGTIQSAAPGNWPGGRNGATAWKDNSNNIWLFGGDGFGVTAGALGRLNDIWKYNTTSGEWGWMKGSNTINTSTIPSGFNATPGARASGNMGWADNAGNLYLFGGNSFPVVSSDPYYTYSLNNTLNNELWKFNTSINQWTQLATGAVPRPDPREYGLSWRDALGNFWLFGGFNNNATYGQAEISDLWKFSVSSGLWTKVRNGFTSYGDIGQYGIQGVPDATNRHGGRAGGIGWVDANGRLWSSGGVFFEGINISFRNDVWVYDPSTDIQTWIKGDSSLTVKPFYGAAGNPSNRPGERVSSAAWADNSGNLWLFGGDVRVFGTLPFFNVLGDFWKYNISTNLWDRINIPPGGGPGPRAQSMTWTDAANNFWIFAGGSVDNRCYNDLWKYNPSSNQWTLLKGNTGPVSSEGGSYGSIGVASAGNLPTARRPSARWLDNGGNLWVFGGEFNNGSIRRNDLWKYEPATNQWTWMSGDNTTNQPASYGVLGIPASTNKPGSRGATSAAWKDNAGNLWLFGGRKDNSNFLNDLWKYDIVTNQWTWVNGDNTSNGIGVYGTKGIASPANKPGARYLSVSWTDANGNFWMMGGAGIDAAGAYGTLNDLWMYNPLTNQWTWVKGDNVITTPGIYGTKGTGNILNKPGSRYGAAGWKDGSGNFWIYGGYGYAEAGYDRLSDLWKISPALTSPLPVHLLEFKGRLLNDNGVLNWKTENEENASVFIVERSIDRRNYVAVGTVAANNTTGSHHYNFTDPNIVSLGASVIYYRLKQKDADGKSTYSNIIALTIDKSILVFFYPNPVTTTANITITVDKPEMVQVRVVNNAGATVKQMQWKLSAGSTSLSIDLDVLASGNYYLDLSGETISKRIPFMKQ